MVTDPHCSAEEREQGLANANPKAQFKKFCKFSCDGEGW
jgi:hypothetical protein